MSTNKKAVSNSQENQLALIDMEAEASSGFESMGQDDLVMPFLRILQSNSPQIDDDAHEYIKGAKAGMFINTATREVYEGPIYIVPCAYQRTFIEWVPQTEGGGFVGMMDQAEALGLPRDDHGRYISKAGNHVMDTRNHYVLLVVDEDDVQPVIMSLKSTQIKKSRAWNSLARSLKTTGKNGKFTPPLYSQYYALTTVGEQNESGSWKGMQIEHHGEVESPDVYRQAKEFNEIVNSGKASVDYANEEDGVTSVSNDSDSDDSF